MDIKNRTNLYFKR